MELGAKVSLEIASKVGRNFYQEAGVYVNNGLVDIAFEFLVALLYSALLCPSNISKALPGNLWRLKCSINLQNDSTVIYPLGVISKIEPGGNPSPQMSFRFLPLYSIIGGMKFVPEAFTQANTVTVSPFSPCVATCTRLEPFSANIFS